MAALRCDMFSFRTKDGNPIGIAPPYTSTIAADIGLFGYRITESADPADVTNSCVRFNQRLANFHGGNSLWEAAQWCAVLAVSMAGFASLVNIMEIFCCNYAGSFFVAAFFLFLSFAAEGCTFMVLGGADYWYD